MVTKIPVAKASKVATSNVKGLGNTCHLSTVSVWMLYRGVKRLGLQTQITVREDLGSTS